jgi:hypothetical protein
MPKLFGALALFVAVGFSLPARAEEVTTSSIGCDDLQATYMAEEALRDKLSGKDRNALDRITAYRKKAGMRACRPLSAHDKVSIVRSQDEMVCVHENEERMNGPDDPECYWMRRRHIKLPETP